jgi:predicted ribosome quality control (RQC) complex YloA/Tae2 family protein
MGRRPTDEHLGLDGPDTDADRGIWRGHPVARRFDSPDGFVILVGRTAADNDTLTFKLASPNDFWFHLAGDSGSHVVVRNPDNESRLPRATQRLAASLAAGHSRARRAGRVAVHVTRCRDVRKPRGAPPGRVSIGRYRTLFARPRRDIDEEEA